MTISEAIAHCVEKSKMPNCPCADEHLQLAKWLQELQELRKGVYMQGGWANSDHFDCAEAIRSLE